jgi:WhiB family transcriptional regulator, redox-sensing transcriptional regulator
VGRENEPDFSGAACGGMPVDSFFPERGTAQITARDAKTVCNGNGSRPACIRRAACLEYALDNKERFGIWGGKSERERARIAKDRRVATKRRELEVDQDTRRRAAAARKGWEGRRRLAVASRPPLDELLAQGLITRGEYNQELIHQEHQRHRAATRSKEHRATKNTSRRVA